jgi:glycosyltransferase involved in cell wall biosynthesis
VLFVGRLVERKGVSHLVDAVSLLRSGVDVRLVIVGDGPERARIESRVREQGLDGRVAVRGRVSEAELQAAYAAADAFVLPAVMDRRGDTEGLGVVLLEAMNHRVPVIASAIGGITDIVEDGVSGLLVPPGDATALAAALERLARVPDLSVSLGDAGYRRLHERFSWEAISRRWVEVYNAAVAHRH